MSERADLQMFEKAYEVFSSYSAVMGCVIVASEIIKEVENSWEVAVSKMEKY